MNGTCDIIKALTKVKLRRNIVTTLRWCRFRFNKTRNVFTLSTRAATKIMLINNAFMTRETNVSFSSWVVQFIDIFVWFKTFLLELHFLDTPVIFAKSKFMVVLHWTGIVAHILVLKCYSSFVRLQNSPSFKKKKHIVWQESINHNIYYLCLLAVEIFSICVCYSKLSSVHFLFIYTQLWLLMRWIFCLNASFSRYPIPKLYF